MICLIGNSGLKHHGLDGQTAKVRLYLKKIQDEGFDTSFIDLENFTRHPIFTLIRIKKNIKTCDRIVLITAERGCKILIPFINFFNRKYKKPVILPLVGTGVLHYSIDKLTDDEKIDFLLNKRYDLCKFDKKTSKQLSQLKYVLPETDMLNVVFRSFFKISNVRTLNNFRDVEPIDVKTKKTNNPLKLVFLSRVMREKGIFDILEAVKELNASGISLQLDIYGQKVLADKDLLLFNGYLDDNIHYLGQIDFSNVVDTLSKYDLFVFPTKFIGEGTPGVVAESLIAGTPVLSSCFPQANILLKDGKDSILFKINNYDDLLNKLRMIVTNRELLSTLTYNATTSGSLFTYLAERNRFLKYICGVED